MKNIAEGNDWVQVVSDKDILSEYYHSLKLTMVFIHPQAGQEQFQRKIKTGIMIYLFVN